MDDNCICSDARSSLITRKMTLPVHTCTRTGIIDKQAKNLIEMETAAFYMMADLLEIPAIALLCVSDNIV